MVFDKIVKETKKTLRKPKTKSKMGVTGTTYTYTCDVCARGYEKKSKLLQVDGGAKVLSQYYMKCDECGRVRRPTCTEDLELTLVGDKWLCWMCNNSEE